MKIRWEGTALGILVGIGVLLISESIRPIEHYSCIVGMLSITFATIATSIYRNHIK